MDCRRVVITRLNKLFSVLGIEDLLLLEKLGEVLNGQDNKQVRLVVTEYLKDFCKPLLVAIDDIFTVPANKSTFLAKEYFKQKEHGGKFDFVGQLFNEMILSRGNRVEGSTEGYALQSYQLTGTVSDNVIIEYFSNQPIDVTLRGLSNFIDDLLQGSRQVNGKSYISYVKDLYGQLMVVNIHFDSVGKISVFAGYLRNPRNWNKGDVVVVPCLVDKK